MLATRTTGECSLISSGEITRAGRVPACSEPSVGSRRTRTISPRFGLLVEGTRDLLFERFPLLCHRQIDFAHFAAPLNNVLSQGFAFAFTYPAFDQLGYFRAALARADFEFKPLQHFRRKRIRSFCHFHRWYLLSV